MDNKLSSDNGYCGIGCVISIITDGDAVVITTFHQRLSVPSVQVDEAGVEDGENKIKVFNNVITICGIDSMELHYKNAC